MNPVESMKHLLPQIAESSRQAREALAKLIARQTELSAARSELLKQGISREDYAAWVMADFDRVAAEEERSFQSAISDHVEGRRGAPPVTLGDTIRARNGMPVIDAFKASRIGVLSMTDSMLVGAAARLFRDQIKASVRASIMSVEPWPVADPVSAAELCARLNEIDAELSAIGSEIEEIRGAMNLLGASEPEPAEATPARTPYSEPPEEIQSSTYHKQRAEDLRLRNV